MKRYCLPVLAAISVLTAIRCSSAPAQGEAVDLTQMSGTMVYAEVFNMIVSPEEYVGKSVRMRGDFSVYQYAANDGEPMPDKLYFACEIADATACCAQGIEFVLAGSPSYPGTTQR